MMRTRLRWKLFSAKYDAKLAELSAGESDEDVKKLKAARDRSRQKPGMSSAMRFTTTNSSRLRMLM